MGEVEVLPRRNHYTVAETPPGDVRNLGFNWRVLIENIDPRVACCDCKDTADMIADALNAQVPVDPLDKPLVNWQLRAIADEQGTVKGIIRLSMNEIMDGIEQINDLACERLAGNDSYKLQDLKYKVVGHADGDTLLVEVTADAGDLLTPEEELTEECQNCGQRFTEDELTNPIPDLTQRVLAGEPMPSGECPNPECRAVCHTVKAGE
jgi:hypothetical protein